MVRFIPEPVRRLARAFREARQAGRIGRALAILRETEATEAIEDLWLAWDNRGWSVGPLYLDWLLDRLGATSGPVLDVGSGLSTVVIGALWPDRAVLSLEQDGQWAELMKRRVGQLGLERVTIRHAPLRDRGGYLWYAADGVDLSPHYGLVACDGPAVHGVDEPLRAAWRVGLLAELDRRGVTVGEILLDDANDPRAPETLSHWRSRGWTPRTRRQGEEGVALLTRS